MKIFHRNKITEAVDFTSTKYLNISIDELVKCEKVLFATEKTSDKHYLPELYSSKKNCCGCSACYSICPKSAISMEPDEEGFLYPVVDASLCIRCYKCLGVCAFKVDQERKHLLN